MVFKLLNSEALTTLPVWATELRICSMSLRVIDPSLTKRLCVRPARAALLMPRKFVPLTVTWALCESEPLRAVTVTLPDVLGAVNKPVCVTAPAVADQVNVGCAGQGIAELIEPHSGELLASAVRKKLRWAGSAPSASTSGKPPR